MKPFLLLVNALLIYNFQFAQLSDTSGLDLNKPIEREIKGGSIHYYSISLKTGEFMRGSVEQMGIAVRVRGFFPDGSKIRSFDGPSSGIKNFRFAAELQGKYILELTARDTTVAGKYKITVTEIQPMTERLNITREERFVSPRLILLQKEIAAGDKKAEEKFWQEIKTTGTPLVEPFEKNARFQLVTFLWKETFKIYNVVVIWNPYSLEHPEDYKMMHLPESNVWYKTLRIPKGARFFYQLSPNETLSRASNAQRYATVQADPLNPKRSPNDPNLTKYETFSIAELPEAPPQPWADQKPDVPAGRIEKHRFKSAILNNERDIAVYIPPNYKPSNNPYPLLVLFDGSTYQTSVPAPTTLDNLIAAKKITPVIAVMIDPANPDVRGEEYIRNPKFAECLARELLPWVRKQYHVTQNPSQVTIGGLSAGGFAAAYAAMTNPEIYGNVLIQSGMFWWSPNRDRGEEPNWMARQFVNIHKLPLQFYMDAGIFENEIAGSGGQILETSRHLRDVLRAKGYQVYYQEFIGGHDRLSWRGTLADGLMALMPATEK